VLRSTVVALIVCSTLATTAAWAQSGGENLIPTAVLGAGGEGDDGDRESVTQLLVDSVHTNPRLEIADQTDLRTEEALSLAGCMEASEGCLGELALTLGVSRLLFASLVEGDDGMEVELRYFDAERGLFLLDQTVPFESTEDELLVELRLLAVVGESVVLRITSDRANVSVSIDAEDYGMVPVIATDLEPGPHLITARCAGCTDVVRQINVEPGRFYVERVSPRGGADDAGGGGDDLIAEGPDYLVPAVTLGAGIALLGTGMAFGIMTSSTQDDFDATPSYDEALRLADEGERQAVLANVFLIGGAAVTAIGGLLFLTANGDEDDSAPAAASASPTPSAWLGDGNGGVSLHWRF
jgi:hypothetical protein